MQAQLLAALLLLGYVMTAFSRREDAIAGGPGLRPPLRQAGRYGLINGLLLLPYLGTGNPLWWLLVLLAAAHGLFAWLAYRYDRSREGRSLEVFAARLTAQLVCIGACYPLLAAAELNPLGERLAAWAAVYSPLLNVGSAYSASIVIAGYWFNVRGATVITTLVLERYLHLKEPVRPAEPRNAGEAIGNLERLLILTLVLQQHYATVGLVTACKTIARYKKLEEKNFAEYFLIGTLTSITIAILTGVAVSACLQAV
ncbi:MAG: hypothetical protein E6X17_08515 [Sporomusaceae bacterium]|nr:hypothetical protein [Sporomusaceae bacterium]